MPKWGTKWYISFDLNINNFVNGWRTVLHLTSTGRSCCGIGDRVPAVLLYNNVLHVNTYWQGNANFGFQTHSLQKQNHIEIIQRQDGHVREGVIWKRKCVKFSFFQLKKRRFHTSLFSKENVWNFPFFSWKSENFTHFYFLNDPFPKRHLKFYQVLIHNHFSITLIY